MPYPNNPAKNRVYYANKAKKRKAKSRRKKK